MSRRVGVQRWVKSNPSVCLSSHLLNCVVIGSFGRTLSHAASLEICLYLTQEGDDLSSYVATYLHTYTTGTSSDRREAHGVVCTYVCMYVCMYVRMYVCMYVRTYVCTVCMYACTYVRMCVWCIQYTYVKVMGDEMCSWTWLASVAFLPTLVPLLPSPPLPSPPLPFPPVWGRI